LKKIYDHWSGGKFQSETKDRTRQTVQYEYKCTDYYNIGKSPDPIRDDATAAKSKMLKQLLHRHDTKRKLIVLFSDDENEETNEQDMQEEICIQPAASEYSFISEMVSDIVESAMNYPLLCPSVRKYEVDFTQLILYADVVVFPERLFSLGLETIYIEEGKFGRYDILDSEDGEVDCDIIMGRLNVPWEVLQEVSVELF
jgi:hypothetical protein